jgi:hypothetical protein
MMTDIFEDLVALDVRGECTDEELEILKGDLRRWLAELNSLKRDVEIQMSAQRARITQRQIEFKQKNEQIEWLRYKGEEEQWRVGSLRFMASVENRILYAKSLRSNAKLVATG